MHKLSTKYEIGQKFGLGMEGVGNFGQTISMRLEAI